jgi:hypothetical protein
LFFLLSRFPGRDQLIVFAIGVVPDFVDNGTKQITTPTDGTELFRVVIFLIDQVRLIEDLPRFFETDAMFPFDVAAFLTAEVEARI